MGKIIEYKNWKLVEYTIRHILDISWLRVLMTLFRSSSWNVINTLLSNNKLKTMRHSLFLSEPQNLGISKELLKEMNHFYNFDSITLNKCEMCSITDRIVNSERTSKQSCVIIRTSISARY